MLYDDKSLPLSLTAHSNYSLLSGTIFPSQLGRRGSRRRGEGRGEGMGTGVGERNDIVEWRKEKVEGWDEVEKVVEQRRDTWRTE